MIWSALGVSLKISIIATFFAMIAGVFSAWRLSKIGNKNKSGNKIKKVIENMLMAPIFFPPSAIGYLILIVLGRRGVVGKFFYDNFGFQFIFTWYSAVIAGFIIVFPIIVQSMKNGFSAIDKSCLEAAEEMGATKFQTLLYIELPLVKRNMITSSLLGIGRSMGEFGATILVLGNISGKNQTLPMMLYNAVEQGESAKANIVLLLIFAISLLIMFLHNLFQRIIPE